MTGDKEEIASKARIAVKQQKIKNIFRVLVFVVIGF